MDVLRYIKGTKNLELVYRATNNYELIGYADSDWASDLQTGKSVYGYVFYLGDNLISWKSKKSTTTATSSTTAELEGLYHATTEGIWISDFLMELGVKARNNFEIYQDNKASADIATGENHLERTKHMITKIEFIRDYVKAGQLKVSRIGTEEMKADIMTKSLPRIKFAKFVPELGMEVIEEKFK